MTIQGNPWIITEQSWKGGGITFSELVEGVHGQARLRTPALDLIPVILYSYYYLIIIVHIQYHTGFGRGAVDSCGRNSDNCSGNNGGN